MKKLPPIPQGHEREYRICGRCKKAAFYDYVPYSFSRPVLVPPCKHDMVAYEKVSEEEFMKALGDEYNKPSGEDVHREWIECIERKKHFGISIFFKSRNSDNSHWQRIPCGNVLWDAMCNYHVCLKKHEKAVHHALKGGEVEVKKYDGKFWSDATISDDINHSVHWSLSDDYESRIKFEREERYLVIKRSDIESYLSTKEQDKLYHLAEVVADARSEDKRPPLECVCVEGDWPIYDEVWSMVRNVAEGKTFKPMHCLVGSDGEKRRSVRSALFSDIDELSILTEDHEGAQVARVHVWDEGSE